MGLLILTIVVAGLYAFMRFILHTSKDLVAGVVSLAFFLPFERIPTIDMAGFTLKINHIVGIALLFCWLANRFLGKDKRFNKNPIAIPLLFMIGAITLSSVQSVFVGKSIIYGVLAIFTIALAAAIIDIIQSKADYYRIEKGIVISAWIVVIFSIWQYLGDLAGAPLWMTGLIEGYSKITFGFPRVQAFSKEPLYLGNYLFIPLGIVFARLLSRRGNRLADQILMGLMILVFILTLSRGALLGLVVFGIFIAGFYARYVLTIRNIVGSVIVLCLAFGGVYWGVSAIGGPVQEKFIRQITIQDFNQSESTVSRLGATSEAVKAWRTSPWVGVGMSNFGGFTTGFVAEDSGSNNIVNNEYFELLAETGVIGLGAFLIIITIVLSRSIQVVRQTSNQILVPLVAGLTAALGGILFQYNFFSTLSIIHIWFLIGLIVALQKIAFKESK